MVRPLGLTFRITQPHGLRILYLMTIQGHCKGRGQILSLCLSGTYKDNNVIICYDNQVFIFKFCNFTVLFAIITIVILNRS